MLGQISASLAAMNRTIDDYDSMTKRELIKVKQEKAQQSVFLNIISFTSAFTSSTRTFPLDEFKSLGPITQTYETNSRP